MFVPIFSSEFRSRIKKTPKNFNQLIQEHILIYWWAIHDDYVYFYVRTNSGTVFFRSHLSGNTYLSASNGCQTSRPSRNRGLFRREIYLFKHGLNLRHAPRREVTFTYSCSACSGSRRERGTGEIHRRREKKNDSSNSENTDGDMRKWT